VFDSGVGGLNRPAGTREDASGGTVRVPRGHRARSLWGKIRRNRHAVFDRDRQLPDPERDIKLLVVACNTASSLALPVLRKIYKIPVVGMVGPVRAARRRVAC